MKKNYLIIVGLMFLLISGVFVFAIKKEDYLTKDYQYCGITECYTQYTICNPKGTDDIIGSNFDVSNFVEKKGFVNELDVRLWNGTDWYNINSVDSKLSKKLIKSSSIKKGVCIPLRVYGSFTPSFSNNGVSYDIDHIPSYQGFTYPEHDLWNQSFNKCFSLNLTYNLKNYTIINESFPIVLNFNSSVINLSALRSDWGDVRFGNGTCQNVTSDYSHNIVYANSSNARMIVYVPQGTVLNNTVVKIAVFYNNSGLSHLEPTNTQINLGNNMFTETKWFSNDKSIDNNSITYSIFNDSTTAQLNTFGTSSIIYGTGSNKIKQILNNNVTYQRYSNTTNVDQTRGLMTFLKFRLYNVKTINKYSIVNLKNLTNPMKTNAFEVYIQ